MTKNLSLGTGRRKTAIARVFLREGDGQITVNGRKIEEYFNNPEYVYVVKQPLEVTDNNGKFNIEINVHGGGVNGQAGACRLGICRALDKFDSTNHSALKGNGFLTRDARMVERKKYGQRGARRKFQFSKR